MAILGLIWVLQFGVGLVKRLQHVNDLENQIRSMQEGKLVNVSLGYSDNGNGIIHVSGYVYNPGINTA